MTIFDRVNITAAGGAGLCGLAMALSPVAAAVPFVTGGECIEMQSGTAAGCAPAGAPLNNMAGVPMALPGPVPAAAPVPVAAPVPAAAPLPVGAPVPVGAPLPAAAPLPAGAPIMEMAGTGKGEPTGPPPAGAPVAGQPIMPGPAG